MPYKFMFIFPQLSFLFPFFLISTFISILFLPSKTVLLSVWSQMSLCCGHLKQMRRKGSQYVGFTERVFAPFLEQLNELVALIPHSDQRLRPQRT